MILPIVSSLLAEMVPTWAIAVAADRLGQLLQLGDDRFDGLLDAALELHRVGAGGDVLRAFAEDRLREHGGGGGAVAGDVGGLAGDFADHLRAHVLERVLQLDFLGDRHAVLGDGRRAELLVEDDVAALGAEGDLHRVGQLVDAAQDRLARLLAVNNLFCHVSLFSRRSVTSSMTPRTSSSRMMRYSSPSILISWPEYLPNRIGVAGLDVERRHLAVLLDLAVAGRDDLALLRLFLGGVGDDDPADLLFAFFDARTMMRSCSGLTFTFASSVAAIRR